MTNNISTRSHPYFRSMQSIQTISLIIGVYFGVLLFRKESNTIIVTAVIAVCLIALISTYIFKKILQQKKDNINYTINQSSRNLFELSWAFCTLLAFWLFFKRGIYDGFIILKANFIMLILFKKIALLLLSAYYVKELNLFHGAIKRIDKSSSEFWHGDL